MLKEFCRAYRVWEFELAFSGSRTASIGLQKVSLRCGSTVSNAGRTPMRSVQSGKLVL